MQKSSGSVGVPTSSVAELKERIKEAESKKKEQGAVEFSLEEALNPTESLAEICKSLGLKSL